jgi:hypothetical protein
MASGLGVEYSLANFPHIVCIASKTPIFGGFSITWNQFLTKSPVQHVPAAEIVFHQPYSGEATPALHAGQNSLFNLVLFYLVPLCLYSTWSLPYLSVP